MALGRKSARLRAYRERRLRAKSRDSRCYLHLKVSLPIY